MLLWQKTLWLLKFPILNNLTNLCMVVEVIGNGERIVIVPKPFFLALLKSKD